MIRQRTTVASWVGEAWLDAQQANYDFLTDEKGEEQFEDPFFLELGAGKHGRDLPERVKIGLNPEADPGSNIYWDLESGIPLPDNCVHKIHSNQVLEHIWNIILLFNEMWRVLTPGGEMWHCVPHYSGIHAWGDPTHVRAFSPTSFRYYCVGEEGGRFSEEFSSYDIECGFILDKIEVRPDLDIQVWMSKP